MFPFTIRDWLWLIVVVVVGTTAFFIPLGPNDRRMGLRRTSKQNEELISARYEAAKGVFEWWISSVYLQHRSLTEECEATERFARTAELNDDLEQRVKDLANALKNAQQLASITLDKYENEVEPPQAVYRTQYVRADIEVRLRRAEQDLAVAQGRR